MAITIRWTEAGDRPLHDGKFTRPRSVIGAVTSSKVSGYEMPDVDSELDRIKFLREEIKFEHKQIADRLSPFVTAQSFVTTAFAISAQNAEHNYSKFVWYAYHIVVPFGFFSASLVLCAIGVGVYRLEKLRHMLFENTDEAVRQSILPSSSTLAHYVSLLYAFGLPLLSLLIWTVVFLHGHKLEGYEAGQKELQKVESKLDVGKIQNRSKDKQQGEINGAESQLRQSVEQEPPIIEALEPSTSSKPANQ